MLILNCYQMFFNYKFFANENKKLNNTNKYPNIYLYILDGYANNNTFTNYYNFDNNKFTSALSKLNFFLIENSKSKYNNTLNTMASGLNFKENHINSSNKQDLLYEIYENKFSEILSSLKYEIFNFSIFKIKNTSNSYSLKLWYFNNLLSNTIFNLIFKNYGINGEGLNRELEIFKNAKLVLLDNKNPKFVYLHTLLPHPPFYLDGNGKYNKKISEKSPNFREIYKTF